MRQSDIKDPSWLPRFLRPVPDRLRAARSFTRSVLGDRFEEAARLVGWLHPDQAAMVCHLARLSPPGPIVEIGSFKGKSTVYIARGMKESNSFTAIDPHIYTISGEGEGGGEPAEPESSWEPLNRVLKEWDLTGRVRVIKDYSHVVRSGWAEPISFLWIDGDHRYEAVVKDIEDWAGLVVPGGYVGFHDTHPNHDGHGGPRRAIRDTEILGKGGFETFLELRNAWFMRRR